MGRSATDYDAGFAAIAASIPGSSYTQSDYSRDFGGSSGSGGAGDLPFVPADDPTWSGTWGEYNRTHARNSDGSWSANPPLIPAAPSNNSFNVSSYLPTTANLMKDLTNSLIPLNTNTGAIKDTGRGYAYTDKYGFAHVVDDYDTAAKYSRNALGPTELWTDASGESHSIFSNPGSVYEYRGPHIGGYAINENRERLAIPLPGARNYGNTEQRADEPWRGKETLLMPLADFNKTYPDYLGSVVTKPLSRGIADTGYAAEYMYGRNQGGLGDAEAHEMARAGTSGIFEGLPSWYDPYKPGEAVVSAKELLPDPELDAKIRAAGVDPALLNMYEKAKLRRMIGG